MASNDPPPPGAADGPGEPADGEPDDGEPGPDDALRRLEERLDRASGAAERLIAEAAAESAARASSAFRRPPPAGWQAPRSEDGAGRGGDLDLLVQLLESLRDLIPPDLQHRLAEALRELLLAVRALINWYLERLERRPGEAAEVQDIPISWE
jgi:hypothetical protein